MWYGEYIHTLDNKERFILPAKFREKLKAIKKNKLYITRGLEGCLSLYIDTAWKKLEEKLESLPFTQKQSRFFNRLLFSGASEIDVDSQGRISLPGYLKEFAQIKREVVIIGLVNRIEVWAKGSWEKFYQENRKNFEEMAENLFETHENRGR